MSVLSHEGGDYPVLYRTFNVPTGSGYRRGFVARPDAAGRFPAVVVLASAEGVTSQPKSIAWQLARRGFSVVVIDPSGGDYQAASDKAMLAAVRDATGFALSEESVAPGRVGLWGLGEGGRVALIASIEIADVGVVVVNEASLRGDDGREFNVRELLAKIEVPVLGLYAADDPRVTPEEVDEAQATVSQGRWILYEGVAGDFLDPDADSYHPGAAYDALVRASQLLGAVLPPADRAA